MFKALVVILALFAVFSVATFAAIASVPTQAAPSKTFAVVLLNDATRVTFEGTHITNNGFCTSIWRGRTLDTTICAPHIATEMNGPPATGGSGGEGDQHKKDKTQASL